MSEIKTNAMRILEKQKISYQTYEYEHGKEAVDGVTVAKLLHQNPEQVFKTLVTRGHSKNYFVFVIPVEHELDLKKAAKAVKEKSVEMIHVSEINAVTGYIRGGCSPIGMKKLYQTVIHESAQAFPTIMVSAGKIGHQVELSPQDLANLIHAIFADIIF
ncbi:MAG: Cys-tRNA(Pro) deacylase [Clostridia bacterium]|nr:Cys-tRNA(Pro) deacylase [Clostridia bacterium]